MKREKKEDTTPKFVSERDEKLATKVEDYNVSLLTSFIIVYNKLNLISVNRNRAGQNPWWRCTEREEQ